MSNGTNTAANTTTETTMSITATFPAYTADNLITLRAAAVNAYRRFIAESRAYIAEGVAKGYLADSAMDGAPASLDGCEVVAASIRMGYAVSIRVYDPEMDSVSFHLLTPLWGSRPWIPSGWSIREERA